MSNSPTLDHIAAALLNGDLLDRQLHLRFGGCALRLDTNSAELAQRLESYYGDFVSSPGAAHIRLQALEAPRPNLDLALAVKDPDPGKTKIKEEYLDLPGGRLVRKRLTGMHFLFGDERHLAVGPCTQNDNQVVNFINSRYIQWMLDQGHLLCHCAAVAGPSGGLALAGLSGRGKSTLALQMMGHGLNFVSNDRLLIGRRGPELSMHGVAKLPRINPGTALNNPRLAGVIPEEQRRQFASLPASQLWSLEHKFDAYLDRCFGPGRFQLSAPMLGLVIISWHRRPGDFAISRVELGQRPDLLEAVMKSPGLFFLPRPGASFDHTPEAFLRVLGDCPVYELHGEADFAGAALACQDLLNREPAAMAMGG